MASLSGLSPKAPGFVRLFNPLVERVIGAGVRLGPNALLTIRGRSSGEPRTVAIALMELDGRRFVQSPFGEVHWVRNLRAAGEATLSRGRRRESVRAVELAPEVAGPIMKTALAPYLRSRVGSAYLGRYYAVGPRSTGADFAEAARTHPWFELLSIAPAEVSPAAD